MSAPMTEAQWLAAFSVGLVCGILLASVVWLYAVNRRRAP